MILDLENARPGPLAGMRVVDLTTVVLGPLATHSMPSTGSKRPCRAGSGDQRQARFVPTLVGDNTVGLAMVYAALAALLHRERTGEGADARDHDRTFVAERNIWGPDLPL